MNTATHQITKSDFDDTTIKCGTATLGRLAQIDLCIESPNAEPIRIELNRQMVIGRAEEGRTGVDINLTPYNAAPKGVSRYHASLEIIGKTLMVTDLNSTNGTFLNGQEIPRGNRRVVRDGDELKLGNLLMHVFYAR